MSKSTNRQKTQAGRGKARTAGKKKVQRKLVGVRIEPRLVKVMKAVAELNDCALGELIEQVFWSAMENESFFASKGGRMSPEMRRRLASLKEVYGVDYDADYLRSNANKDDED